eukprot:3874521-Rhodomonas_salina.1
MGSTLAGEGLPSGKAEIWLWLKWRCVSDLVAPYATSAPGTAYRARRPTVEIILGAKQVLDFNSRNLVVAQPSSVPAVARRMPQRKGGMAPGSMTDPTSPGSTNRRRWSRGWPRSGCCRDAAPS